jgi:hypothetical protein
LKRCHRLIIIPGDTIEENQILDGILNALKIIPHIIPLYNLVSQAL